MAATVAVELCSAAPPRGRFPGVSTISRVPISAASHLSKTPPPTPCLLSSIPLKPFRSLTLNPHSNRFGNPLKCNPFSVSSDDEDDDDDDEAKDIGFVDFGLLDREANDAVKAHSIILSRVLDIGIVPKRHVIMFVIGLGGARKGGFWVSINPRKLGRTCGLLLRRNIIELRAGSSLYFVYLSGCFLNFGTSFSAVSVFSVR